MQTVNRIDFKMFFSRHFLQFIFSIFAASFTFVKIALNALQDLACQYLQHVNWAVTGQFTNKPARRVVSLQECFPKM